MCLPFTALSERLMSFTLCEVVPQCPISAGHIRALAHSSLQDTSFPRHKHMPAVWEMHIPVAQCIHIQLQTDSCVLLLIQPTQ